MAEVDDKPVVVAEPNESHVVSLPFVKDESLSQRGMRIAFNMGPSGSGKTTLLDVLAGRKTTGEIKGEILFAGVQPRGAFLRRYSGYVEQFDTLLDILTVEEMMLYTAELKRPQAESLADKKEAVASLIERLGLAPCKGVKIGNALARGISGGQAKRTNIGIALITNPRVLFLDEPTSGLDSYTSNEVMTVVKDLVSTGITICATIHSPTPYCFALFDRLILLLRGRVVYFGDRGAQAVAYFHEMAPAGLKTSGNPEFENEAEWIVDITTQADRQGRSGDFADSYDKSALKVSNHSELATLLRQTSSISSETLKELSVKRATVTGFWWALKTLIKYRTSRNYKDGAFLGPRLGDKVIMTFLIFTLYWGVGDNFSESNVINIAAVLFMWCTLPAFAAAAYTPSIVLERPLFIRELNDGLYRVITYLVAKMVDELMLAFVSSIIFSLIVFFALQLQGSYFLFWLVYFVTMSIGIVMGYFVAALAPNMEIANAALPAYTVTLLFFAGFLIRLDDVPNYWIWYVYIDFIHYGWSAQMVNQFSGTGVKFAGKPILDYYGLGGAGKWAYLGYEIIFFFTFFAFAYLALRYVRHSKR